MEFVVLGWPDEGPTLRLDYRQFSYAGKFVMSNTGKAVVRPSDDDTARDVPAGDRSDADDRQGATNGELAAPVDPDAFDTDVVAAIAFNEDRTDPSTLWLRYVTVRRDRRGEGLGPRLAAFVTERARRRGYDRITIAVNNPFAYEALYKAGFGFTGEQTGLAELVLERPGERDRETYQAGLDAYRARDVDDPEASFLAAREGREPPARVDPPPDSGG